jgi:hypothetical protein
MRFTLVVLQGRVHPLSYPYTVQTSLIDDESALAMACILLR